MNAHPSANLFPMMSNDDYAALVADIHQHGQREPIWVLDGQILDGRNRWRACRDLGIAPVLRTYEGPVDSASLINFVVSLNLKRRHLDKGQLAFVALNIEKALAEDAKAKETERKTTFQRFEKSDLPEVHAAEQAAAFVGTNRQYVSDAKKIALQAPDLADQVIGGTISLPEAKQLLSVDPDTRAAAIDRVVSGEAKNVNKALTELRNETKRAIAMAQPAGVYNVIYADPPWEYSNTGVHGAAESHYPTMPLEAICSLLDDQKIRVADNAVLFLWATNPFLQDAFYVINSWGFTYKTNMVWVKTDLVKPGSGFYVRGRHELLLICTRGSFTPIDAHISPPIGSVVNAAVAEHSAKPDEFYTVIERLYPDCQYLELFSRRQRENWEGWGYDSNG